MLDHARFRSRIEAFVEPRFAGATQVDDIESAVLWLSEVVEAFTTAATPTRSCTCAPDLDRLERVVDRIRRSGKVTGTKTLIVLGSARPSARRGGWSPRRGQHPRRYPRISPPTGGQARSTRNDMGQPSATIDT